MSKQDKRPYLFLMQHPSFEARRAAAEQLRELSMTVVAHYGSHAIEALATDDQAEAASRLGIFSARLKGAMGREHLEKLDPDQLAVVQQWNTRFTGKYRKLTRDARADIGKPWNGDGKQEPLPYSAIGPEDFLRLVADYEKRTGETVLGPEPRATRGKGKQRHPKPMSPKEFADFERRLAEIYGDRTLAYHLARLAFRLGPWSYDGLLRIPKDLIAEILRLFFLEAACWRMTGEMSVGIVFVESSASGGPKFGTAERNEICQEILDGHSWLTSQHPTGNLSWVYDFQFVKIGVANGSGDPDEPYWRDPAMGEVSYNGQTFSADWSGVGDYREAMRIRNFSAHAMVIFVTPYANSWHAYASNGRVTLANKNNWGGWGRGTIDAITAHETSHLFGSADEYTGSGTPCSSCETTHGCDNIPNGNCGACSHPHQDCIMDGNSRRLCGYTRGQIGWSHIFVETTTADELWAGTDDDVWLDIGDRDFVLDTPDHDDRERNAREGYALWAPTVQRSDIKRILIRKSPDGFAGGWKLNRVRTWYRGSLICDVDRINTWLEDDHRVWVGCISDRAIVSRLRVEISTANVMWAGTDDDVTLTLGGRSWNLDNEDHDDFERGNTDTFDLDPGLGLHESDIHSVRIHKSSDGIAGGWKLKGVRIVVNGHEIYNKQSINKWLEDNDRTWTDTI
ncbi:MAG: hypothetical protein KDJ88_07965 [Bauldia sp.]|nr:hypothetical protein [Bauldia sp.]